MDLPDFNLVVKSASDKIPSQLIEYKPSWSVKDLKRHLCEQYPTHPQPCAQRLVHAGKLLKDDILLEVVFKDPNVGRTIHLVCRTEISSEKPSESSATRKNENPLANISPTELDQYKREYYDYLKQFYVADINQNVDGITSQTPWWAYGQFACSNPWQAAFPWNQQGNYPNAYGLYSGFPGSSNFVTPPNTQAEANGIAPQAVAENNWFRGARAMFANFGVLEHGGGGAGGDGPAAALENEGAAPQQQLQAQQQPIMVANPMAAGFMGADEMGDNAGNLDIVDRFYMVFRLCLFIGLCFAYSSLDKAIIVFSVAAYVYFYNIYRRHAAVRQAAAPMPPPVMEPADLPRGPDSGARSVSLDAAESPGVPTESGTPELRHRTNAVQSGPDQTHVEAGEIINPEPRLVRFTGGVRLVAVVCYQFFSSLITSLIPEQPPPIQLD